MKQDIKRWKLFNSALDTKLVPTASVMIMYYKVVNDLIILTKETKAYR